MVTNGAGVELYWALQTRLGPVRIAIKCGVSTMTNNVIGLMRNLISCMAMHQDLTHATHYTPAMSTLENLTKSRRGNLTG